MNAIEAMSGISANLRELRVSSEKVSGIPGELLHETREAKSLTNAEWTHVLITVRDSGPGLGSKNIDRLFDAFYTTKTQGLEWG